MEKSVLQQKDFLKVSDKRFLFDFSKIRNIIAYERVAKLRKSSFAARFFVRKKEET